MRGWSHQLLLAPSVSISGYNNVVGQHLLLNIIPNNFIVGNEWKIWCDRGLRGWSHRPLLTPSVTIFSCNSVTSGGPKTISQHNPQPCISRLEPDGKFGMNDQSMTYTATQTPHHHRRNRARNLKHPFTPCHSNFFSANFGHSKNPTCNWHCSGPTPAMCWWITGYGNHSLIDLYSDLSYYGLIN